MSHSFRADPSGLTETIRVFVSYTHDSPAHKHRVARLADRLRADGIDCEIDVFEEAPPEGWPVWMARQLREARFVLVVCTTNYHRRVTGREAPGIGLGARWEGALITQHLYETGGKNNKFIPVVFERADLKEIPDFLRHTTYYDLSDTTQYEKLYRRLTAQPHAVRRPVGTVRRLPPEPLQASTEAQTGNRSGAKRKRPQTQTRPGSQSSSKKSKRASDSSLVLIRELSGRLHFAPLASAEIRGALTVVLRPDSGAVGAYFEGLATSRFGLPTVDIAFGLTAFRGHLKSVVRSVQEDDDRFTITLAPDQHHGGGIMEMATTGYSADDIAVLRARRILLDESLSAASPQQFGSRGDSMLESFVQGLQTSLPVDRSPLPECFRGMVKESRARALAATKLLAVLWLRATGTGRDISSRTCREALLDSQPAAGQWTGPRPFPGHGVRTSRGLRLRLQTRYVFAGRDFSTKATRPSSTTSVPGGMTP